MDIAGTGITPFTAKVLPGYTVDTQLAIKWRQLSSGNWAGLDRTSAEDIYETTISIYGKEAVIDAFIDEIEANRTAHPTADAYILDLTNFFSDEKIFGENVDYTGTINATAMSIDSRLQGSWKGWGVTLRLRAISPSLTGSSSFPTLSYCETGVQADSNYTITKNSTYSLSLNYNDHSSDSGTFTGVFTVSRADAILLRNYIQNQRTGNFTLADTFGVNDPFGSRSANSYSYTTKLIGWQDLGLVGQLYNRFSLTFAEVV